MNAYNHVLRDPGCYNIGSRWNGSADRRFGGSAVYRLGGDSASRRLGVIQSDVNSCDNGYVRGEGRLSNALGLKSDVMLDTVMSSQSVKIVWKRFVSNILIKIE